MSDIHKTMSDTSDLDYAYFLLKDAAAYCEAAALDIRSKLEVALTERGTASLLVSGGSSPKPVYEALSQMDMAWDKVTVSLVDERWVQEGEAGSNADFIKDTLLQNKASAARFVSLVNQASTAKAGVADIQTRFEFAFPAPIDVCIMGMGTDGHTASWFPRSQTLPEALNIEADAGLVWQDASGQAGGSGFADRITVNLPLVMHSKNVYLLIPGQSKAAVWAASADKDVCDAPVTALRAAGPRLHVFTHEGAA
jgi:6-phosphogluconolactonase